MGSEASGISRVDLVLGGRGVGSHSGGFSPPLVKAPGCRSVGLACGEHGGAASQFLHPSPHAM